MGKNLKIGSKFKFYCHDQLACFKQCCKDINIFLTPYDILRMKNKLGISSEEFLKSYTHVLKVPHSGFPVVVLKMQEDNNLICPFISNHGCQVYHERPWSCRMAPVEIRGAGEYGIAFEPSRCHGLNESREWTVQEWMDNQGLAIYTEMEELFGGIPLKVKRFGQKQLDQIVMDMILISCYDLDRFRKILLENPQLIGSESKDMYENIVNDDVALMKFAFKWLPNNLGNMNRVKEIGKILG